MRYVDDASPGWRRVRRGRGFSYHTASGDLLNGGQKEWIQSLAIPPAWTDVWISPERDGHILATGRDDAGRKQYIYNPLWEQERDRHKFTELGVFGRRLPGLRRSVDAELRRPGMDRSKVVALVVAVLDRTLIRVGNRAYAEENDSYGLTTLTGGHVDVVGTTVNLAFVGKGGAEHELAFRDRRLAGLVTRCAEMEGQTLFSYETDDGAAAAVTSNDVNLFLGERTKGDFTAKHFRTWGATTTVVEALASGANDEGADRRVAAAVEEAAARLGNTPTVCRDAYVHPGVVAAVEDGSLQEAWRSSRGGHWLTRAESATRKLLADDRFSTPGAG